MHHIKGRSRIAQIAQTLSAVFPEKPTTKKEPASSEAGYESTCCFTVEKTKLRVPKHAAGLQGHQAPIVRYCNNKHKPFVTKLHRFLTYLSLMVDE
ncbi:hypothetical protein [Phormidesmis priestleyi]|uniref:hypothetical protein n=1 Tax=Phormidesmis priestleyi TaxID=268141 RepID=UPI00083A5A80|nr:hypothetical protein [Phormidesmis priestleyi]